MHCPSFSSAARAALWRLFNDNAAIRVNDSIVAIFHFLGFQTWRFCSTCKLFARVWDIIGYVFLESLMPHTSHLAGLLPWIVPRPWKDSEDGWCWWLSRGSFWTCFQVHLCALKAHEASLRLGFLSMGANKPWELLQPLVAGVCLQSSAADLQPALLGHKSCCAASREMFAIPGRAVRVPHVMVIYHTVLFVLKHVSVTTQIYCCP